ncbi:MAG: beta-glucuronidase [Eubacteriales bacterium]
MLYPRMNGYRDVYSLNGIWNFRTVGDDYIPVEAGKDVAPMPVPASFNEIVTDRHLRDHVGKVLYETTFSLPLREERLYRLRIGSASHKCEIYLNGEKIGEGINGHYPIDLPLENLQAENRLSVVIDNRLDFQCLPTGKIENGRQVINHDFYNFTGIHRDVLIYTLPQRHIEDIVIRTVVDGDYRKISVDVKSNCERFHYTVFDRDKHIVAESDCPELTVSEPRLWSPKDPYLYTLAVQTESDRYEERFGIRKVSVTDHSVLLNDEPVYFKGFGMHEDFTIMGKGKNTPLNVRNFELLKWIHANCFRTSHYPYSEEMMDLADEYGILVIDEVPAVGMIAWEGGCFTPEHINEKTAVLHKELIKQLVERDKNHPCVVMLSLANEPASHEERAKDYFADIFAYARTVSDLPLTFAENMPFPQDLCCQFCDVILLNRYYAWYDFHGDIDGIREALKSEAEHFYDLHHKPIILSEFGADTIEGTHTLPAESFSEEYQLECIGEACKTLDGLDYCIGELVWNFADFKTKQGLTRARGNRKGVFTRDRQPKLVAHYLRSRWENKS